MPEIAFALIVGFVLGLLVGYLMRSESRQYEVGLSGHEDEQRFVRKCRVQSATLLTDKAKHSTAGLLSLA